MRSLTVTTLGLAALVAGVTLFDWRAGLIVLGALTVGAGLFFDWGDE